MNFLVEFCYYLSPVICKVNPNDAISAKIILNPQISLIILREELPDFLYLMLGYVFY